MKNDDNIVLDQKFANFFESYGIFCKLNYQYNDAKIYLFKILNMYKTMYSADKK